MPYNTPYYIHACSPGQLQLHRHTVSNLCLMSVGPTYGCQHRSRLPCSDSNTRRSTDSTFLFALTLDGGTRIMTSAHKFAIWGAAWKEHPSGAQSPRVPTSEHCQRGHANSPLGLIMSNEGLYSHGEGNRSTKSIYGSRRRDLP